MPRTMGVMARCKSCRRMRLVDIENGLCILCENSVLKERVALLEFQLNECSKQKAELLRQKKRISG